MFKKSPQITQILTSKYIFVIIRVICGRKKSSYVLLLFCFQNKHTKKETLRKASLQKSWVDDGDRTHDPQDHNLIL